MVTCHYYSNLKSEQYHCKKFMTSLHLLLDTCRVLSIQYISPVRVPAVWHTVEVPTSLSNDASFQADYN